MPNQLNKNKNKLKDKDEIRTTHEDLILAQQAERRRRFQKIVADGRRSTEALLEETRQRVELVEEAQEEFLNWCSPREENPDGRESTRTARSAEGAKAWSELFVRDILLEETDSLNGDPSSPTNIAAKIPSVSVKIQSVSVGIPSVSVGIPSVSVRIPSVSVGLPSISVGMAGPKEKLPKFDGDEAADPI